MEFAASFTAAYHFRLLFMSSSMMYPIMGAIRYRYGLPWEVAGPPLPPFTIGQIVAGTHRWSCLRMEVALLRRNLREQHRERQGRGGGYLQRYLRRITD